MKAVALAVAGRAKSLVPGQYKSLVRDGLAFGLAKLGATTPGRFARAALTVVTFHRVLPADQLARYPMPGLAVTPDQLEAIVERLLADFRCLSLIDAFRSFRSGEEGTRPLLAITFDDGALDNFEHAAPVIERLGAVASFYIPVCSVEERDPPWHDRLGFSLLAAIEGVRAGREDELAPLLAPFLLNADGLRRSAPSASTLHSQAGVEASKRLSPEARASALNALEAALGGNQVPAWAGLMTWSQVRELALRGHEVGSHSLTHPLLPDCSSGKIEAEIAKSRERLRHHTGVEVASFCYPNGSYDQRCLDAVQAAGYECSVTTRWGLNRRDTPPHELRRCDMDFSRLTSRTGAFSSDRLLMRLSGMQPGLR